MSLFPDAGGRLRDRSRSRSRDGRSKDESAHSSYVDIREPTYAYPDDDLDARYKSVRAGGGLPYPEQGGMFPGDQRLHASKPISRSASPSADPYRRSRDEDDRFKYLPQKYSQKLAPDNGGKHSDREKDRDRRGTPKGKDYDEDLAYGKPPGPPPIKTKVTVDLAYGLDSPRVSGATSPGMAAAAVAAVNSYIGSSQHKRSVSQHGSRDDERRALSPGGPRRPRGDSFLLDPRMSAPNVLTLDHPGSRDRSRSRGRTRADTLTVEPSYRDRSRSRDGRGASPQPPTARMSTLSVDTGRPSSLSVSTAPASPLLESYRGTYQDCSPMPSPMLMASQHPSDSPHVIDALSPLGSDSEGDGRKRSRRARFHDSEDITSQLASALKGSHQPDTAPLIEILPSLSHEQVMELRTDYKAMVKTGSERKGVNIAKHIRARLKDENPLLMKAAYTVALGKWESEAYWANFWYHGDKTRRELLIESLMGRTNAEIAHIKDGFTDKKYDNSLTKCMKTELKEDKFKKAVLMVLEERRMEDFDSYGRRLPLDYKLIDQDVEELRRALKTEKGGESAMISIVIQRSDNHLREVLKEYERQYRGNFAREALKKSGNLVGEVLAHILNGVINRPVRDALLLHHAITASRKDDLRRELLISRLVRYHWDPFHMQAIKRAYAERYGINLQDAVREATSGEWGLFCRELCIARMPNEVRRVSRVAV